MNFKIILNTLSDGAWHKFDELSTKTHIEKDTVLKIMNFFRDFGIVEINIGEEAAKLDNDYQKL